MIGPVPLSANQWTHVAGVYDGTKLYLYVNGSPAITPVSLTGPITESINDLQIGHDPSNPSGYYIGLIDEASVYSSALSAAQIQSIYLATTAGKCVIPATITSQPANLLLIPGMNAVFTVSTAGTPPIAYQWLENGSNILSGATKTTLTLTNVQLAQSGTTYSMMVSNAFGAANSSAATLTVVPQLLPSTQDLWDIHQGTVVTATSGVNAPYSDIRDLFGGTFSPTEPGNTVFADGQPPGFIHYVEWKTIAPVNITSFALFGAGDGPASANQREFAQFTLKAKSSAAATNFDLTLYTLPITNHPYFYQDPIDLAVVATNIPPVTAQYFRAEFVQYTSGTGVDGPRIIELDGYGSNPLTIVNQPADFVQTVGGTATFTVGAIGTPPINFQWQVNGTDIQASNNPSATNSTLSITNVQPNISGDQYSVTVSSADSSTNSDSAMLTVVPSQTRYVSINSTNPTYPFTSWDTAATNIQDAVDAAVAPSDAVLVSDGIYQYGGRTAPGSGLINRLIVTNAITVQSVSGPAATIIKGFPGFTNGIGAIRCAYLAGGAELIGFTLTNGGTINTYTADGIGGGVYCPSSKATLFNCIISGNSAYNAGGGVFECSLINCTLAGNTCIRLGGGAAFCSMTNCVITNNVGGGVAVGGTVAMFLKECVVVRNSGGGVSIASKTVRGARSTTVRSRSTRAEG